MAPVLTLANTFGAFEIGTMVAMFLFGIVTLQTEYYLREFPDDKIWMKLLVIFVWLLELGHTVGICIEVYRATIIFNGQPTDLNDFTAIGSALLFCGVITLIVQGFFSLRVWRLLPSPYRYLGIVFITAAFVMCGFNTYLAHQAIIATSLAEYVATANWINSMVLSVAAGIDVLIACSMMYFFMTKRKNTFHATSRMVDRLVGFTIRTGLLTSLTAIGILIGFQLAGGTYIWVALYCSMAKMYSNSFLSALNGRQELRRKIGTSGAVVENSASHWSSSRRKPSISVIVDVQTEHELELQQTPGKWESQSGMASSAYFLEKQGGAAFP